MDARPTPAGSGRAAAPDPADLDPTGNAPPQAAAAQEPDDVALARPAGPGELFRAFNALALQGFGGVLAVTQRVLVEERRWLTRGQFLEMLSLGQLLPGPNVCNLALMVGDRYFGLRGAFAALAGMMALPSLIVIALAAAYMHFAPQQPLLAGALRGMGFAAAGLIAATALRLAPALRDNVLGRAGCLLLMLAAFAGVGLLRLPLLHVLLLLGAAGWLGAWFALGRRPAARDEGTGARP